MQNLIQWWTTLVVNVCRNGIDDSCLARAKWMFDPLDAEVAFDRLASDMETHGMLRMRMYNFPLIRLKSLTSSLIQDLLIYFPAILHDLHKLVREADAMNDHEKVSECVTRRYHEPQSVDICISRVETRSSKNIL